MKLTDNWIKKWEPCTEGIKWLEQKEAESGNYWRSHANRPA